jgi:hypothetical protein
MTEPQSNEFYDVLRVLNNYYRSLVIGIAEEVRENRDQFDAPFLANAEAIFEKYARLLQDFGIVYNALDTVGVAIYREKLTVLDENEYVCFSCRSILRKGQKSCPQCGWSWSE